MAVTTVSSPFSPFSPSSSSSSSSPYPFASAPDIVRSHQKDTYFTAHLATTFADLHRRLFGARSAHALAPELRTLAALLYFSLTTLPGNRTLGEEYCDLVQLDTSGPNPGSLPNLRTRAAYIAGTILLPYLLGRALPGLRSRLRNLLEPRLAALRQHGKFKSREARIWEYTLTHLLSITSAAPVQALTLAIFYFNGTYYDLTKRLLSLRYVFTRTVPDTPDRAGYELLGVLLVIQLGVQAYLHVHDTLASASSAQPQRAALDPDRVDVLLHHDNSYSAAADPLLGPDSNSSSPGSRADIATTTHTPVGSTSRFLLEDEKVMGYIRGDQQRKCTLCLEEMKDPAATQCGHVFCWECIGDWVREKPECPLCRRETMIQHILPLRTI